MQNPHPKIHQFKKPQTPLWIPNSPIYTCTNRVLRTSCTLQKCKPISTMYTDSTEDRSPLSNGPNPHH